MGRFGNTISCVLQIICVITGRAVGELTVLPLDTEAMVGKLVSLNCSTSNPDRGIHWLHYPVESAGSDLIYGYGRVQPQYTDRIVVERIYTTRAFNLVIPSVETRDAGRYLCQDEEGQGNKSYAQLVVLTSSPVCESSIDTQKVTGPNSCGIPADQLTFSCSVSHYGKVTPLLQWKKTGENGFLTAGVSQRYKENSTTCELSLKGDLSMDGASYVCHVTRARDQQYSCTSDVVKIQYAFNDFSVLDKNVGYEHNCVANSSQFCYYRWLKDERVVPNLSNLMKFDEVGTYRCEADCQFNENTCTVSAAIVHITPKQSSDSGKIALIVLLIIVLIALIVVIIVFIFYYKTRPRPKVPPEAGRVEQDAPLLGEEVKRLNNELETLRRTSNVENSELQEEIGKLKRRQKELSRLLFQPRPENVDYIMKMAGPITTKTTVREMRPIRGLAIIDKELFIASMKSQEVEVYDSTTFRYSRGWALAELVDVEDLAACTRKKCLFFSDNKQGSEEKKILCVGPNGNLMHQWSTGSVSGRLSVTDDCNVLFTVLTLAEVREYAHNGDLLYTIHLAQSGMTNPLHALKLTTGHLLISHGFGNDVYHRVCIVDTDGEIIKSFGKKTGSGIGQMQGPICLAVDAEGSIIVADCNNSRLLLLNSVLEYKRNLDSEGSLFEYPVRICLNQANGRMFVADLQKGNHRLTVFDLDKPALPDIDNA